MLFSVEMFMYRFNILSFSKLNMIACNSTSTPTITQNNVNAEYCLIESLLLLPSVFPSIRVFSNESALCIRWPKYWGFNFSISPSNEYLGLISFKIDWFDLLAVQGTLKHLVRCKFLAALVFY